MKCQFCNSEWQSKYVIATCPFCGQKIIDDSADSFDTIVDSIYKAYGYEILKEKKKKYHLLKKSTTEEKNFLKKQKLKSKKLLHLNLQKNKIQTFKKRQQTRRIPNKITTNL